MTESNKELEMIIEIETLLNALQHDGNAQVKPIMGKILGTHPEFRSRAKEIGPMISEEVKKVAELSLDVIESRLEVIAPVEIEKIRNPPQDNENKAQRQSISELPNAKKGDFRVRYAPDPSKFPHLGQGIAYLINRIFADKYDGEVLLRFDDTNPYIVKPIYYEAIKEGMKWLGATWDKEVKASDHFEDFYQQTRRFIEERVFYVCFCDGETKKKLTESGKACDHRGHTVSKNLEEFEKMIDGKYKTGDAIVRLIGDLSSDNPVMRDPIMLRLVDKKHPMQEKMYYVSPTYDFESSYFEAKFNITHVIRSGEFGTMRQELQSRLIELLGGIVPEFVQFGRINIQGCPTKGRVIRQLVEDEVVDGWDDIRLITLQGLKKRGLHPKAAREIVNEVGITPQNTQIAWSTIEAFSRRLLEPESKRLYFVENPIKVIVDGEFIKSIEYPFHPDNPEWGIRKFEITNVFYISKEDSENLEKGDRVRFKDLFNVEILDKSNNEIKASYSDNEIDPKLSKIQWVTDDNILGKLIVPLQLEDEKGNINKDSKYTIEGYFEKSVKDIKENTIVQLERIGFAKFSKIEDKVEGHIVHLF